MTVMNNEERDILENGLKSALSALEAQMEAIDRVRQDVAQAIEMVNNLIDPKEAGDDRQLPLITEELEKATT